MVEILFKLVYDVPNGVLDDDVEPLDKLFEELYDMKYGYKGDNFDAMYMEESSMQEFTPPDCNTRQVSDVIYLESESRNDIESLVEHFNFEIDDTVRMAEIVKTS